MNSEWGALDDHCDVGVRLDGADSDRSCSIVGRGRASLHVNTVALIVIVHSQSVGLEAIGEILVVGVVPVDGEDNLVEAFFLSPHDQSLVNMK